MTREEAKQMFRDDKDAYGKPKTIMSKIDKIFDDFEKQESEIGSEVIFIEDKKIGGFTAYFREIPNIIVEGETKREAYHNLILAFHDIIMYEHGNK